MTELSDARRQLEIAIGLFKDITGSVHALQALTSEERSAPQVAELLLRQVRALLLGVSILEDVHRSLPRRSP